MLAPRGLQRLDAEFLSQILRQGRPRVSAALSSLRPSEAGPLGRLRRSLARIASATVAALASSALLIGQVKTNVPEPVRGAKPVTVERISVHGAALEGNLEGNAVDRDVIVFLPPSYARERTRRYPVIYALHGYSIGAAQWSQEI